MRYEPRALEARVIKTEELTTKDDPLFLSHHVAHLATCPVPPPPPSHGLALWRLAAVICEGCAHCSIVYRALDAAQAADPGLIPVGRVVRSVCLGM